MLSQFYLLTPLERKMNKVQIKVKKLHQDAKMPEQANPDDAGYDIFAIDDGIVSEDGRYVEYDTGLSIAPEAGYHVVLCPRSSISKYDLLLCNSIGLIDNSYRGPLKLRFRIIYPKESLTLVEDEFDMYVNYDDQLVRTYKKGDRIAQIKVEKTIAADFTEVDELQSTQRGDGGFGSSGK
jgi:dUTP pyrophosphatase